MRILFLTERFPYPLHDGGNLRTYHVLKGLASRHDVVLAAHRRAGIGDEAIRQLSDFCRVELVDRPGLWRSMAASVAGGRILGHPLFVAKNWSQPLLSTAQRLLRDESFDAVHFNHLDTACFARDRRWSLPCVLDTHNCLSAMARELAASASSPLAKAIYVREARLLAQVERDVCRKMDAVLACSQEEADALAELAGSDNCVVAPNGVDCEHFQPQADVAEEPLSLVFTGAMDYFPNEDAAIHLCRDILPRLADIVPRPKVYLVGRDPSATVRALADGRSVVVTGKVDDVRPYLARAALVVVPLRHGAGTRLKILEAFAMGKAVVSTYKGAEGISAASGEEILLAGDAAALAEQIRRALASPDLRRNMGVAAARLARQRFDWPRIQETVLDVYQRLGRVPALAN